MGRQGVVRAAPHVVLDMGRPSCSQLQSVPCQHVRPCVGSLMSITLALACLMHGHTDAPNQGHHLNLWSAMAAKAKLFERLPCCCHLRSLLLVGSLIPSSIPVMVWVACIAVRPKAAETGKGGGSTPAAAAQCLVFV